MSQVLLYTWRPKIIINSISFTIKISLEWMINRIKPTLGQTRRVNRNNRNENISSTSNTHCKVCSVWIWRKSEFSAENKQSVRRWRARQRGRQWEEKLQCLLEYALQWRSPCPRSQFLTHQLILLKAWSQWFCLEQAESVYDEGQCKWKHMRKYTSMP